MAPLSEVHHFGHGPEDEVYRSLVNYIRPCLARLSQDLRSLGSTFDWAETFRQIRHLENLYNPILLCQAVIQSCNQEFGGHDRSIQFLVMCLLLPREYYLAVMIFKFFSNGDHTQVMDVICSLKSREIRQTKNIYHSLFRIQLEVQIETYTFGNDTKLLLRHISDPPGNASVDAEHLNDTVRYLHENVQGTRYWTQVAIMDRVYGLNEEDLRIAAVQYNTHYENSLAEDLARAGPGPFKHGLLTKIGCAVNRPEFFAGKLQEALGEIINSDAENSMDVDNRVHEETIVRVITTVPVEERMMMKENYSLKSGVALETDISASFANRQYHSRLILMILGPGAPN